MIFFESVDSGPNGIENIRKVVEVMNGKRCKEFIDINSFQPKMLLRYQQDPSNIVKNDRVIHSFQTYRTTEDGIQYIISIVELYPLDSIMVFCRSNEQVNNIYQGIANYYNNIKQQNKMNFDLFRSGRDGDGSINIHTLNYRYGEFNSGETRNKFMYYDTRRKDFEMVMNVKGKRKVTITTDLYNNINIGASIAIHYGLHTNRGFNYNSNYNIDKYTRYGYYLRRIGRLQCTNNLSITLILDSRHEYEFFKKMMTCLNIEHYFELNRITNRRRQYQREKFNKFNCNEIVT